MKQLKLLVLLLLISPGMAFALGLGNLDIESGLNEPFAGRIELLSATLDELDSLTVGLADQQAFNRAGIERPFLLSRLKFTLQRPEEGTSYILVQSQVPILEPFLNFLVEVSWARGRLFREYTVLLDPPLYDPEVNIKKTISAAPVPAEIAASLPADTKLLDDPEHQVVYTDAFDEGTDVAPAIAYDGGDYGPTQSPDTLWGIASAARPDGVSINRMMLALLRTNPNAFIDGNINGLKRGQILSMPTDSELTRLSNTEVLAEINSQHALWGDIKNTVTTQVAERPAGSSGSETPAEQAAATVATINEPESELKLVAASTVGNDGNDQAIDGGAAADSTASAELTLAQESIQALTQENVELTDRLQESEILLEDLKRLIALKDDELASLQSQFAQQAAMAEEAAEAVEQAAMAEEAAEAVEPAAMAEEAAEAVEPATMAEEAVEADEPAVMTEEAAEAVEQATMAEEAVEAVDPAVMTEETEQELITEDAAEGAQPEVGAEDATEEVVEESLPAATGIMGMVNTYLTPIKNIVTGNSMIVKIAGGATLLVIIIALIVKKFRQESAEVLELDTRAMSEFSDAQSDAGNQPGIDVEYADQSSASASYLGEGESEAITDVPKAATESLSTEDNTPVPDFDEEQDPLQEVNTYLAFEQFGQAEEFVRNVIERSPDNPEGHIKLLEVFYTSGNKQAYEEAAHTLHDLVSGQGEYWNMAVAMWAEMSPNRALFEEGADEPEDTAEAAVTGVGIVDIATDDQDDNSNLDFDIGLGEEESVVALDSSDESRESDEEALLDMTVTTDLDGDASLNMETGAATESDGGTIEFEMTDSEEDIAGANDQDNVIEFDTASINSSAPETDSGTATFDLDMEDESNEISLDVSDGDVTEDEVALDLSDTGTDEVPLDLSDTGEEEISLDLSDTGTDEVALDLSDTGEEEMSLDLSDTGTDEVALDLTDTSEEEMSLDLSDTGTDEVALDLTDTGEEEMSLDLSDTGTDEVALDLTDTSEEEMSLDLSDTGTDEVALDLTDTSEEEMSLDLTDTSEEEMSLDLSDIGTDEVALDLPEPGEEEMSLDLADTKENEPSLDASDSDDDEIDFDFNLDEDGEDASEDADFEKTIVLPKSESVAESNEDGDETTVFVPRSATPDEQSLEDEIATKLDLAKAYVELDDKNSAKSILDEVIAEGNAEQKKQAEALLSRV